MAHDSDTNLTPSGNREPIATTAPPLPIRLVALPPGLVGHPCPECGAVALSGALITETADEHDPNIYCQSCGYWRQ